MDLFQTLLYDKYLKYANMLQVPISDFYLSPHFDFDDFCNFLGCFKRYFP